MNINKAIDKAYEGKTFKQLADAPVDALQGVSAADAQALAKAFNVKTIRDLQPNSEAAKAGLRDGDVVTYGQALDALQGDPEKQLTLQVVRGGKTFPISYLPRAEEVEIYQWKRVPGVPDTACGR